MKNTRIALVQMQTEMGNVDINLARITAFVEDAKREKADLICFPELSVTGYCNDAGLLPVETVPGPSARYISLLAQTNRLVILAGLAEQSAGEKPFIAQIAAFPEGSLHAYRKTHLGESEKASFAPGDALPVFSTDQANFGIGICWDMHFPEVAAILSLKGSEIIFAPHASPRITGDRREIWMKYLPARAYDNGVFVAACNLVGRDGRGKEFSGGLMVIDPRGNVTAEDFSGKEEMLVVDLDSSLINTMRRGEGTGMSTKFFLASRRPELYHDLTKNFTEVNHN